MISSLGDNSGVHIVASGLRCAVGFTPASTGAAVRAGISQVGEHPFLTDAEGDNIICALDPSIDLNEMGTVRITRLAELCLHEIVEKLSEAKALQTELRVLLALPEPRPGFDIHNAVQVAESLASERVSAAKSIRVDRVGEGHAGALRALQLAVDLVSNGQQELVVVGGVDSYLEARTLDWLDSERRLARSGVRSGFPPGEGAAFIVVASVPACKRLGLHSLARIRGIACKQEHRDPKSDTGLLGEALSDAVLEAAKGLSLPQEIITDTYGDINGELARSHDWGFALMRTADFFRDGTDYVSYVGSCGDVGAATGIMGCVLATEAWKLNHAQGPRALVWAGSWGGLRAAVVLEQERT